MIDMVRRVADTVFIPFTVGGGIRSAANNVRGCCSPGQIDGAINSPSHTPS